MKIKIKKCTYKNTYDIPYWYRNKIGEEFEVRWETFGYYFVTNKRIQEAREKLASKLPL